MAARKQGLAADHAQANPRDRRLMTHARGVGRRPLLFVGLVLGLLLSVGVAQASAETFGEIGRFGAPSPGHPGTPGELTATERTFDFRGFTPWHVLGVEPVKNDVYVLEEYKAPTENGKAEETRFLRLQEFGSEGSSKGLLLAHTDLTYTSPPSEENSEEAQTIEGIAVDPATERLYFLVDEQRAESEEPTVVLAENKSAAASLYAFKTKPNSKKELEPAEGTKAGVLAGPEKLAPTSNTPGVSLIEPHGITVDQKTGEVIIVGHVDDCKEEGGVECGEDEISDPADHYAARRVKENGELGEVNVDSGNVLKKQEGSGFYAPGSPVEVGSGASEHLLANDIVEPTENTAEDVLDEFPALATGTASRLLVPDTGGVEGGFREIGEEAEDIGGSVVSPEGTTLYGVTEIQNEEGAKVEGLYGISERNAETLAPIGWTGGQRADASDKCALQPGIYDGEHIQIAAGSKGDIFVLVPEYLREPAEGKFPTKEAIIEFGPGGEGCPKGVLEKNVVSVAGRETTAPVGTGVAVTLSSFVKQADALSVLWKLENETTHEAVSEIPESEDQYQSPALVHSFAVAGKYKITEEVTTDNLDTPKLTVTRSLVVETKAEEVEITTQPVDQTVLAGETAKFTTAATGKASVKWWVSAGAGAAFKEDSEDKSTNTDTLEVPTTKAKSGHEYYAVFKGAGGLEVQTKTVTLTVTTAAPKVAGQPANATVTAGENASFSASATGGPTPSVQWEVSSNAGASWTAIAGATSATYTVTATTTAQSGYQYRAVFTNEAGSQASSAATLTVNAPPPPPPPPPPPSENRVLPNHTVSPTATISGAASVTVSSSGAVSIKVSCIAGATTCIGSVTLRTLTAVSASAHLAKKVKKAILTLASGSFSLAGGQSKAITLHLSATARKLLAKMHVLPARATVASHDAAGEPQTTVKVLTLKPAKKRR